MLSASEARLQDRLDLRGLLAAGAVDLDQVRALLAVIDARGYGRGKALERELDAILGHRPTR